MNQLVRGSFRGAALWDEVKDKLKQSGVLALGRAAAAPLPFRTVHAVRPRHRILMDEPCSALDPIATLAIEKLVRELVQKYTIIIVTHNMQQALALPTTPHSSWWTTPAPGTWWSTVRPSRNLTNA